ncbi:alkane 1-monooxygenase [Actinomadura latina]|uniref:Alkane 1-monooxygenase n=1 Tax=Actinomadura latina TaxID=163603 RepID=A0A846Z017_9ACTN|nr:alkane 1-monooxygenase [Actinomadura latina]
MVATEQAGGGRAARAEEPWRDPKRYFWLLGLLVPAIPFSAWGLVNLTGLGFFWWLGPVLIFAIFPVFDLLFGEDATNPPESAMPRLAKDRFYMWANVLYIPIQYASLIVGCSILVRESMSLVDRIGFATTIGTVGGIAIAAAHEMGHRRERVEVFLAKVTLAQTGYGHFVVEHNRGHHARVATPEDPATSRMGESFYRFLPRTVLGGVRSCWRLEKGRLARQGKSALTPRNNVIQGWLTTAALFAALTAVFGLELLPYLFLQAVLGFTMLEVVNYLEHYGLLRQQTADGRYVRTAPEHSWNSNRVASNVLLYNLQRHSDHHANPGRRYQLLRDFPEAPQLPAGYATMILRALVPPWWFRIMDKKLLEHYDGDINRCNIAPAKRAKLLARHGAAVR